MLVVALALFFTLAEMLFALVRRYPLVVFCFLLFLLLSVANYFLWLAVLSWSDVSWALPLNALEYILVALAAAAFLGERVGPVRWAGIVLIAAGVLLLYGSWEHPETAPAS